MIKIYFLILFTFTLSSLSLAQVTLVRDLNPGTGDGFDEWNYHGLELNSKYILPAKNDVTGLELFVIENNDITLLKDIWPGSDASAPDDLVLFDGKIYFIAENADNGREIWSTDGTEIGTTLAIEIASGATSTNPTGLIIGNNNKLYFAAAGKVYMSDGTTAGTSEVTGVSSVSFEVDASIPSAVATPYKNGLAFFSQSGTTVIFYYHDGSTAEELSQITVGSFTRIFGLTEVSAGLTYGVDDSFDNTLIGLFVIDKTTNLTTELLDGTDPIVPIRVLKFTTQKSIFKTLDQGFYSTDGTQVGTVQIAPHAYTLYQGEEIPHAVIGNKMVFYSQYAIWDIQISVTDGTAAGTSVIAVLEEAYLSQMITKDNKAFWAAGISNGFTAQLWMADVSTGTSSMLHEFTETTTTGPHIVPIMVVGNSFYFNTDLKGDGRELYAFTSSVLGVKNKIFQSEYKLVPSSEINTFIIKSENKSEILTLEQWDIHGRFLNSFTVAEGEEFSLHSESSMYLLKVSGEKGFSAFKIFIK